MNIDQAMAMVFDEYTRAQKWPAMNSAHEGYRVILEEVDELWDEIKLGQNARYLDKMTKEAAQVAAMAVRFLVDICNESRIHR